MPPVQLRFRDHKGTGNRPQGGLMGSNNAV
jgi:hypothetical protein